MYNSQAQCNALSIIDNDEGVPPAVRGTILAPKLISIDSITTWDTDSSVPSPIFWWHSHSCWHYTFWRPSPGFCWVDRLIGYRRVKSRRLDSHQHEAVYGTAAFLNRATPAKSTPTRIRTRNASFEARYDRPFHHRGVRKASRDINHHPQFSSHLPSSPASLRDSSNLVPVLVTQMARIRTVNQVHMDSEGPEHRCGIP